MEIQRIYLENLLLNLDKPSISILIGPRQVGKSYLLKQVEKICKKRNIPSVYYNLEFPDDLLTFSAPEKDLVDLMLNGPEVIFIDEFHYLKNATKILKAVHDAHKNKKIFASGSSSLEIHKHLKESLAGRFRIYEIYPFTVGELTQLKKYHSLEYFITGGMPGLIHEKNLDDKMYLLKNIVETYLLKDIKSLLKEENIMAFNHLLYFLAQHQGSIMTVASLAREVRLSEPAVHYHLEILEHTRVCFPLHSYSGNLANELKKTKKYYLYDTGIRNSLLNDFSPLPGRDDSGPLLESCVFLAFKRQLKPNMEIRFWRTRQGDEVDFILLKNRIPCPVEVKLKTGKDDLPAGLKKFLLSYKNAPAAYVISLNYKGESTFDNRPIHFLKWDEIENFEFLTNK